MIIFIIMATLLWQHDIDIAMMMHFTAIFVVKLCSQNC